MSTNVSDPKLLASVLARPLDDAPRRAVADALTAAGDPRGAFIVAQCRLAERGLSPRERRALKNLAADLASQHSATWTAAASGLDGAVLRRGFLDTVRASASALAPRAAALFASEPVTTLTVTDATADTLAPLARDGAFARVLHLTIRGVLDAPAAGVLAAALKARKTALISLNVGGTDLDAEGAAALAPVLAGCKMLSLTENVIGDEGLEALAKSKTLASLETLFVTANDITDDGAAALARSPALAKLARLGVARNDALTPAGLKALAKSKKLKALRWVEYSAEYGGQRVVIRAAERHYPVMSNT